jgi:hypothetical protein
MYDPKQYATATTIDGGPPHAYPPHSQNGYASTDYTNGFYHEQPSESRKILGLRPTTFYLLLALIVVVLAAAIAGGVGGSIAVNNAKTSCLANNPQCAAGAASGPGTGSTSSASGSATSTNANGAATTTAATATSKTTAWGPIVTNLPYSGCPAVNNTIYTSVVGGKYALSCGKDIPFTSTSDILAGMTNTFQLCMELCSSWNLNGRSPMGGNASVPCRAVAFIPSHVNGDGGGAPTDCVLKSSGSGLFVNPSYEVHSGVLIL